MSFHSCLLLMGNNALIIGCVASGTAYCIWIVIEFQFPISISLVSFQRNVANCIWIIHSHSCLFLMGFIGLAIGCAASVMTVSTENAAPPKSTKSKNSDSLVSRGTNSNFDLIWICTKEFEFLHLLDFGVAASSVETVIQPIVFWKAFNINFQSLFHWSLFNGTWQKRPRSSIEIWEKRNDTREKRNNTPNRLHVNR